MGNLGKKTAVSHEEELPESVQEGRLRVNLGTPMFYSLEGEYEMGHREKLPQSLRRQALQVGACLTQETKSGEGTLTSPTTSRSPCGLGCFSPGHFSFLCPPAAGLSQPLPAPSGQGQREKRWNFLTES